VCLGGIGLVHPSETPAQEMTRLDWLVCLVGFFIVFGSVWLIFPGLGGWIDRGNNPNPRTGRGSIVGLVAALSFVFVSVGASVLIIRFVLHRE